MDENFGPEAGEAIYPSKGSFIVLVRYVILDKLYRNPSSDSCCTFEQISFNRVPGYILKHIGVPFVFPLFSPGERFFSMKCSTEFQNCLSFSGLSQRRQRLIWRNHLNSVSLSKSTNNMSTCVSFLCEMEPGPTLIKRKTKRFSHSKC